MPQQKMIRPVLSSEEMGQIYVNTMYAGKQMSRECFVTPSV